MIAYSRNYGVRNYIGCTNIANIYYVNRVSSLSGLFGDYKERKYIFLDRYILIG